jgi:REP element-mobilizing transposase RayT
MRPVQGEFSYRSWGGARIGAGRKRVADRKQVEHRPREALASRYPVHVTVRLQAGLPSLRQGAEFRVLLECFRRGCERFGFRLIEYSVLSNHLHLMVEAKSSVALSRGMQGLLVRIAKGLNKLWSRRGRVFSDRFHDRILRTPRQVRHALLYVLQNAKKHGLRLKLALDYFSSAAWFGGWREKLRLRNQAEQVTAPARTWLILKGWRRSGLLSVHEAPRATSG